jgi:glycosyltransferase involved in cell wall biosynthesis
MELSILNVAFPLVPVGRDTVGGAEQIVAALDRALTARGHRSFVVAARGSKVSGIHIPTPVWIQTIDSTVERWARAAHARAIRQALEENRIDVVHLHGLDFIDYLPDPPVPALATLHLPPAEYPPSVFNLNRPRTHLNCVSSHQFEQCPPSSLPIRTIPNGVDIASYATRVTRRNYVLALGRICPEKGFHFALDAARAAGVPIILGGQVFPFDFHQRYFEEQIVPRLTATARFVGPLDFKRKRRLLAGARCLLIPSTVAETSSLVAMEAFASGTPVIAFPSGALAEIVEHGRTGFLVKDAAEMAAAIPLAGRLDPVDCRQAAIERFSARRMEQDYINAYCEISRRPLPRSAASLEHVGEKL